MMRQNELLRAIPHQDMTSQLNCRQLAAKRQAMAAAVHVLCLEPKIKIAFFYAKIVARAQLEPQSRTL